VAGLDWGARRIAYRQGLDELETQSTRSTSDNVGDHLSILVSLVLHMVVPSIYTTWPQTTLAMLRDECPTREWVEWARCHKNGDSG
jgi:hypothetical protein